MKKFFFSLFLSAILLHASAQTNTRPPAIGISFLINDFITPQRIRSGSLAMVFRNHSWAKFSEVGTGLGLHYYQGIYDYLDFSGTFAASFVNNVVPSDVSEENNFLMEADASVHLKMFTENNVVIPYLSAGIGASKYRSYYGAIIPLGLGIRVNLFDEASIFLSSQYRIPVTDHTNNYHFMHSIGISGIIGAKRTGTEKPVTD